MKRLQENISIFIKEVKSNEYGEQLKRIAEKLLLSKQTIYKLDDLRKNNIKNDRKENEQFLCYVFGLIDGELFFSKKDKKNDFVFNLLTIINKDLADFINCN